MANIKILVAIHKKYKVPEDSIYLPVHVGAQGKDRIGYIGDNTGDNISSKNQNYCELTGLYWMWKNVEADYVGLVHYRRYFASKKGKDKWQRILNKEQIENILENTEVILPPKRNYYIESTYNQYAHAHHAVDLDTTREIISEKYPEYLGNFDKCMNKTSGHKFNMFVMKKSLADSYCKWLFDILFELEKRLDISSYSKNDARVFGFVSERLIDVWLDTNQISYKEQQVLFMEKQNWFVKGGKFLLRKVGIK